MAPNTPCVAISAPCEICDGRSDCRDHDPAEVRAHFALFGIIIREVWTVVEFRPAPATP